MNPDSSILSKLIPKPRDVVGVDLGRAGTKVVRLRTDRDNNLILAAADILPPYWPPDSPAEKVAPLELSKRMQAWSAGVAHSFPGAVVKLLGLPSEKIEDSTISELLGLPPTSEYRVSYQVLDKGGQGNVPVVGVGVTVREIGWIQSLVPAGKPALGAIEVSGLATLAAYQRACVKPDEPSCDLVIEAGECVTMVAICFEGRPIMLRQTEQGVATVVKHVMSQLGVDEETARDIIQIGAIDVRNSMNAAFEEFFRQMGIAVDFAERRSGHRIERIFVSGGLAINHDFKHALQDSLGIEPRIWNPWEGATILPHAISENAKGNENVFHAATGVAIGLLEV